MQQVNTIELNECLRLSPKAAFAEKCGAAWQLLLHSSFLDATNLYHPDERRLSETKDTPPCTAQFTIVNSGLHCSLIYSVYSSMRTSKIVTLND